MSEARLFRADMAQVVDWFQRLNAMIERESDLNPGPESIRSPDYVAQRMALRPCAQARFAFLENIPDAECVTLGVLMYAGRDGANPLEVVAQMMDAVPNARTAVHQLSQKFQVRGYIDSGLTLLSDGGLEDLKLAVSQRLAGP